MDGLPATATAEVTRAERVRSASQPVRATSRAATPLVQAVAADVPEAKSQRAPRTAGGTAPSTPEPGATRSGFTRVAVGSPGADQRATLAGVRRVGSGRRLTRARGRSAWSA